MNPLRPALGLALLVLSIQFAASPALAAASVPDAVASTTPAPASSAALAAPEESMPPASDATAAELREVGSWAAAGELEIELTAGSVRIVPGAAGRVRVLAPVRTDDDTNVELRAKYSGKGGAGRLDVRARDELVVTIEVPPSVALAVKMSAGELHVGPIAGDKDVKLAAGELVLRAGDADQAADVQLSVVTGQITWRQLGVDQGGFFRSYERDGSGPKLRARVTVGELRII
jgi:hypothetical protein